MTSNHWTQNLWASALKNNIIWLQGILPMYTSEAQGLQAWVYSANPSSHSLSDNYHALTY